MKFIPNWRSSWRYLSMQAAGVGGVIYTVIQIVQEAKSLGIKLPEQADDIVAYLTLTTVIIGRIVKQDETTPRKDKSND